MTSRNLTQLACSLGLIVLAAVALAAVSGRLSTPQRPWEPSERELVAFCQAAARAQLLSPSSARFSALGAGGVAHLVDGSYAVTGDVTSQNGFGVPLTSSYRCLLEPDRGSRALTPLQVAVWPHP